MYALRVDNKKDTKKIKGIESNVVARTITFDDYTRCLFDEIEMTRKQSCIRSKLHDVYTVSETKIALSPYDDKRYIMPDSTETVGTLADTLNVFYVLYIFIHIFCVSRILHCTRIFSFTYFIVLYFHVFYVLHIFCFFYILRFMYIL